MSFVGYKNFIDEGDTAILYLSATSTYALEVKCYIENKHGDMVDNVFQTTYGALRVRCLIGMKYGSRVELSKGWCYVLHPTPELWTLTLPHRTQIIYTPDASLIVQGLELQPGSAVFEAGTGSGSLTHALSRAVGPAGRVYTFDFHSGRVDIAREEFGRHGLVPSVQVRARDVCQDGFGVKLINKADAVFLDLPHPWLAVKHVVNGMKKSGGRFCSFSPCIEQVQKTSQELRNHSFHEVTTVECLQREFNIVSRNMPLLNLNGAEEQKKFNFISSTYGVSTPGHTGYLTFATLPPIWARNYYGKADSPVNIEDSVDENVETSPSAATKPTTA